jgi:hypothetical protein
MKQMTVGASKKEVSLVKAGRLLYAQKAARTSTISKTLLALVRNNLT